MAEAMDRTWSSGWADAERHALLLGASMTPAARFALLEQMQRFAAEAGAFQREIKARLQACDQLWASHSTPPEK